MSDGVTTTGRLAEELLRIGAVVFSPDEPFTWASGIRSPVYVDNRLTLAHPEVRRQICAAFAAFADREKLAIDAVVGTATAGIPHAAWLADRLGLPMAYVRGSAKQHGRLNKVEGGLEGGMRVVLVEDLVSTGGSSLNAVGALHAVGVHVLAVLAIFTYELRAAAEAFRAAGVPLHVLTDFSTVFRTALRDGHFTDEQTAHVMDWHRDLVAGEGPDR